MILHLMSRGWGVPQHLKSSEVSKDHGLLFLIRRPVLLVPHLGQLCVVCISFAWELQIDGTRL